jgi:hypothetical protein
MLMNAGGINDRTIRRKSALVTGVAMPVDGGWTASM